jgi:hypothetical protein
VRELWEEDYQQAEDVDSSSNQADREVPPARLHLSRGRQSREPDPRVQYIIPPNFYDDKEGTQARDKYENYINLPPRSCENSITWWAAYRDEYPCLSKMAFNLFSVLMMSAGCEKTFSVIKNLITERRNELKEDIIEACTLLRHWHKKAGDI